MTTNLSQVERRLIAAPVYASAPRADGGGRRHGLWGVRPMAVAGRPKAWAAKLVGGPVRLRIVIVLATALGLDGADKAAVSATTGGLEQTFHIGQTEIGLIASSVSLSTAVCMLPAGMLADRVTRTKLLSGGIACWAVAMVATGLAPSYPLLLAARIVLGAAVATAIPSVASLTGDYFPALDRARVYGLILCGELVGTGIGFLLAGELASWTFWRVAFWALAVPAIVIAVFVARLPEPERGGQVTLEYGRAKPDGGEAAPVEAAREGAPVPRSPSTWWTVRYVLSIRTNVLLIIASTLGYFYFAGVRTFAVPFGVHQYSMSEATVSPIIVLVGAGSFIGVIAGGRISDHLLKGGHPVARIAVPIVAVCGAVIILCPAFLVPTLTAGLPLLILGAGFLGAPNPALDAARLDIVPAALWGRAEAVRAILRTLGEAIAPTTFGFVSEHLMSGTGRPLAFTFALFLAPLLAAPLVAVPALRSYPRDAARVSDAAQAGTG